MKVGVIGVQGAVSEHLEMLKQCNAEPVWIRKPRELDQLNDTSFNGPLKQKLQLETVNAILIPGGESTTISRLLLESGMFGRIKELGEQGMPIFGTCAGLVLLAKEGCEQVERTEQKLLGLMDMSVCRNAFGSQRDSFESDIEIQGIGSYPGVFIRAPAIEKTWNRCKPIATFENKIIAAKQDNMLATSFHPELTGDKRMHELFLEMV